MQQQRKTHRRRVQGDATKQVLPTLLIAAEIAAAMHKNPKTIYKWAKRGTIPSINIDGSVLFDPDEIRAWIDQHRMAA